MKSKILLLLFLCSSYFSFAQIQLQGKVVDKKGQPVFAANVYLKSNTEIETSTDFDGKFKLTVKDKNTILEVSFIGYKTKSVDLSKLSLTEALTIVLEEDNQTLSEVIIKAEDPISKKFSVTKIKKLDVYFNPVAQGDALKAITLMPASTTTDETANPSLRGSSPDRTRVMLNGVPVYTPVRSSQLNNQGFFSLFNTEIIHQQYVYASNPPLTYGNSSAGLVEIQTIKHLSENQRQISLSLGAVGFFLSQKIKNREKNFLQLYGNYHHSKAFIDIQKKNLSHIKSFHTKDIGLNFHHKLGDKVDFNSYNYVVDEDFNVEIHNFNYFGKADAGKKRFFSINSLKYYTLKGTLSINTGISQSHQNFNLGNIHTDNTIQQLYASVNFKTQFSDKLNLQTGVSYDYHKNTYNDSIPLYPFAIKPTAPQQLFKKDITNRMADLYAFADYEVNKKLSFSAGLRTNLPTKKQTQYLNAQAGMKYHINDEQSLLLSAGKYTSYATPNYYNKQFTLLKSNQIACDYTLRKKKIGVKGAIYYKEEEGKQSLNSYETIDKVNTFGVETYVEYILAKHLKLMVSNLFINQKLHQGDKTFRGNYDLKYLSKCALQYSSKWFTASLSYMRHPGGFYTTVKGVIKKPQFDYPIPVFSDEINGEQYKIYNKIDLAFSRYTPLNRGGAIIPFLSITNILNTNNQGSVYYNEDFSQKGFDSYGKRVIYFGVIWEM